MQCDGAANKFPDDIRPMLAGDEQKLRKQVFDKCCHVLPFDKDF